MANLRPSPDDGLSPSKTEASRAHQPVMLSPQNALRIVRRRTGGKLSVATFYRWISSGRIVSVRLGYHIFIPWYAVEDLIEQCLKGERV